MLFASEGAKVVVADLDESGGSKTAESIREMGSTAIFAKTDVRNASDVQRLIEFTVANFGRLDCAFNNAGVVGRVTSTTDCSEENWDRIIDTNLKGVWLCVKYEIPQMLKQGRGAIVNVSSVSGLVGLKGFPAESVSRHGIVGLTKVAALEYADRNIRINAVCPGVIRTAVLERFTSENPQAEAQLVALEPMRKIGTPEEVAEAVVWLCSDAASFVTGHSMVVDGGLVAQ
jgi:NAD(P)-dependent dehydrogenase (short-subunit alcohol dehydrogenase family)